MKKIKIRESISLLNVIEIEGFPCPYTISLGCFCESVRRGKIVGKFKAIYEGVNRWGIRQYQIIKRQAAHE